MPTRKADARTYPTITRAEAEAWRDLHRQLARTRTLQDAKDIAAQAPPPHAKRFYARLRSFVRTPTRRDAAREASCTSMASSVSDLPTAVSLPRNHPRTVTHEKTQGAPIFR
jgi:hypothetical protein